MQKLLKLSIIHSVCVYRFNKQKMCKLHTEQTCMIYFAICLEQARLPFLFLQEKLKLPREGEGTGTLSFLNRLFHSLAKTHL